MGRLILTGISSIACADAGALQYALPTRARSVAQCRPTQADLMEPIHLPYGCPQPVELLSDMSAPRHQNAHWVTRRIRGQLPARSLAKLDDDLYVTRPEYFFLKRARKLSFAHLFSLAMELCGGYSTLYSIPYRQIVRRHVKEGPADAGDILPDDDWGLGIGQADCLMRNGYVQRPALTTASKLKSYVYRATGSTGRCRARRVVDLLQDGSMSPGETRMFMLACLPSVYGGSRLTVPELNRRIDLADTLSRASHAAYYVADMCWPTQKVVGEYDGRIHSSDTRRVYDDERRLLLASMGYKIFTLDHASIRDDCKVDAFVHGVARELGQHLYPVRNPEKYRMARRNLRRHLFDYEFDLYRDNDS